MMYRLYKHVIAGFIAMAIVGLVFSSTPVFAESVDIKAAKVKKDPAGPDDALWGKAKEVKVTLDGAGQFEQKQKDLLVKALYTKKGKISVLMTWDDPTRSMDGEAWVKEGDQWSQKTGSEDRVAINWEVRRIKKFATKGCAIVCHSDSKDPSEWKYHTEKAPQLGDLWVWESYRSQPMGYAGDYFVDDDSRKADKGTGKALKNINKYETGPVYMPDPGSKAPVEGGMMASHKVEIGDNDVSQVPAWMLSEFSGDFSDIKAVSSYKNGKWAVMMQRKLKTDSDTDVQINIKKDFSFGIAVFDNSGRQHSYNSPPMKMLF